MIASTFPELLDQQLRAAPSRPLVTLYDDATGERVELSVATYANWVAKTAGLMQDELDLSPGDTVALDLPVHWLGPVWLGAVWSLGASAAPAGTVDASLVVCGPDGLAAYVEAGVQVVACSLLPMGVRFQEPLPTGVIDFGAVVWGQPDVFMPLEPVTPDLLAWSDAGGTELTQRDLLAENLEAEPGVRLLTDTEPCTASGLSAFLGPLAAGGGTVWVRHADDASWEARAAAEQATQVLRQPRS